MNHDEIRDFFMSRDRLAATLGISVDHVGEGTAVASMEIDDRIRNGAGLAHGGAIFSLADIAFGAASNSHGTLALAVNATISFIRPGVSGRLTATARELSRGSRLATYQVEVAEETGRVIAAFQGTVYRKDTPLDDL